MTNIRKIIPSVSPFNEFNWKLWQEPAVSFSRVEMSFQARLYSRGQRSVWKQQIISNLTYLVLLLCISLVIPRHSNQALLYGFHRNHLCGSRNQPHSLSSDRRRSKCCRSNCKLDAIKLEVSFHTIPGTLFNLLRYNYKVMWFYNIAPLLSLKFPFPPTTSQRVAIIGFFRA